MATKRVSEDFSCLYLDDDNDSDTNPDDEEWESPSDTTGPEVCQVESITMTTIALATITLAVESGSAVPQVETDYDGLWYQLNKSEKKH